MKVQSLSAAIFLSFVATAVAAPCDDSDDRSFATGSSFSSFAAATSSSAAAETTSAAAESSSSAYESSSYAESSSVSSETASSATGSATTTASVTAKANSAAASTALPASSGSSTLSAVQTIAAGETYDGGMYMIDRGVSCTGQDEGGDSDAVFELEDGATLSNVIIGPNQIEGVHCYGSCTLDNVWWSAVCEDAFTIKEQDADGTTTITGGGAFGADDKVFQHNGGGTLSVSGFTVDDFGKLYRSCGNCDSINYGDTATFTNIEISDVETICAEYEGNDTGDEPEEISTGPSDYCIYSTSDITES
ncbi:putative pectate lyase [Phaeomoniella chlamydospora]|uniref:Pectate lyase n=1 Tax=Phaeomoniella chlamydospora TaxID=158046 RepID=A0A0G2GBD3_PHACM|nr:putative pectate lyase [Phaeomoniella chlamydospora]